MVRLLSTKHHLLCSNMSKRGRKGINQQTSSHAYREDTGKNDPGWAFLAGGSAPPKPDEEGPAITAVIALAADEDGGTCKTPSKSSPSPPA
jgi:hypothetical protein